MFNHTLATIETLEALEEQGVIDAHQTEDILKESPAMADYIVGTLTTVLDQYTLAREGLNMLIDTAKERFCDQNPCVPQY